MTFIKRRCGLVGDDCFSSLLRSWRLPRPDLCGPLLLSLFSGRYALLQRGALSGREALCSSSSDATPTDRRVTVRRVTGDLRGHATVEAGVAAVALGQEYLRLSVGCCQDIGFAAPAGTTQVWFPGAGNVDVQLFRKSWKMPEGNSHSFQAVLQGRDRRHGLLSVSLERVVLVAWS